MSSGTCGCLHADDIPPSLPRVPGSSGSLKEYVLQCWKCRSRGDASSRSAGNFAPTEHSFSLSLVVQETLPCLPSLPEVQEILSQTARNFATNTQAFLPHSRRKFYPYVIIMPPSPNVHTNRGNLTQNYSRFCHTAYIYIYTKLHTRWHFAPGYCSLFSSV